MTRLPFTTYIITVILFSLFSWLFIDTNFPLHFLPQSLAFFTYNHRGSTASIYIILFLLLFCSYALILRQTRKNSEIRPIIILIIATVIVLFFAFPGFSFDIFNYIATAKVTFLYKENPYIVMPIEIPNEPMLAFMHAANKTALYGPFWIALTGIPFILGFGNLMLTIFMFKALVIVFYAILLKLIWRLSGRNLRSLVFFGLNPLVVTETLLSAHNDVVMMALVLASFYFLKKNKFILSLTLLFLSVLIKFATLLLLPIFIYWLYRKLEWQKTFKLAALAMYIMFFLSPLREEIYAWYLIWPLTFVALIPKQSFLQLLTLGFSLGLPFRITPYLYTREWTGLTPFIKKLVTFVPPFTSSIYYAIRKKI